MAPGDRITNATAWARKNAGQRIIVVSSTVPVGYKATQNIEYKDSTGCTNVGWTFSGRVLGYHETNSYLLMIEPQEFTGWAPTAWEAAGASWLVFGDISSCWWVNANMSILSEPALAVKVDLDNVCQLLAVTDDADIEEAVKKLLAKLVKFDEKVAQQKTLIDEQVATISEHNADKRQLKKRADDAEAQALAAEARSQAIEAQVQARARSSSLADIAASAFEQRRRPAPMPPRAAPAPPPPPPPPKRKAVKSTHRDPIATAALAREQGITVEELEADASFRRFGLIDWDDDKKEP